MNESRKIAVMGSSGFVGSRIVEMFHLSSGYQVVPVVRNINGLARLSRFELDCQIADARFEDPLSKALAGCDAVVHSVVGIPEHIEESATALTPAAAKAGVKRIVFLSSASVHGLCPDQGTNEESPLSDQQEMVYNNAKVRAERILLEDAAKYGIELFILRPSIVFGPRDRWVTTLAADLKSRQAWLINDGRGICNTVYVDNLVHAVQCCLEAPAHAAGQAYFIGDAENITWGQFYQTTAVAMGLDENKIHHISIPTLKEPSKTLLDRLSTLRELPGGQQIIAKIPKTMKTVAKSVISGLRPVPRPNPWMLPQQPLLKPPTKEMLLLQQSSHWFPRDKANKLLGYEPQVSFGDGLNRSLAWLEWCGMLPSQNI